jgi:hypothetical protein
MYINQLVDGMNEEDLLHDPDEWRDYRPGGIDKKKALFVKPKFMKTKAVSEDEGEAITEGEPEDPFSEPRPEIP